MFLVSLKLISSEYFVYDDIIKVNLPIVFVDVVKPSTYTPYYKNFHRSCGAVDDVSEDNGFQL